MAADALFVRGDKVAAEDLARRALTDTPSTAGVVSGSIVVYTVLSLCAASDGDYPRALELLADGRRATAHLGDETVHHAAYFESLIASMEAARGDPAAARAHATEAVRLARESELPVRLAQALTVFARISSHDDPEAAERALDEVLAMPRLATSGMLVGAFSLRAQLRANAGDSAGALGPLHEALLAWDDSTAIQSIHVTIESAATIFADLGNQQTAAVLAGAATTGPLAPGWAFSLSERARADLNQTIDRLRAALGPNAYDIQAAHGAAMSRDDLLRYLRDSVDTALAANTPETRSASEDIHGSSPAETARNDT
jgi:ATP/maltotriose-dependent transcriptional regulator MalT